MNPIAKLLIALGILFIVIGVVWQFGSRFFSFGRLPGDIVIEKQNVHFYFPIVTCLILSIVLSIILYLLRIFWK